MTAQVAIQCVHPETHKIGCWLFVGPSHRTPGTAVSPIFDELYPLFKWCPDNGWTPQGYDYVKDTQTVPDNTTSLSVLSGKTNS